MQKEFFKIGKTETWKKLKNKFKSNKQKALKEFFSFVNDPKTAKPGQHHEVVKNLGGSHEQNKTKLNIECIAKFSPQEQKTTTTKNYSMMYEK